MQHTNLKSALVKSSSLVVLFISLFSFSVLAGRDSYEIYLNNKLIQKQYVGEASTGLAGLQLDNSNYNDKLVINYVHCNTKGAGKGRNIEVRNAQGQILKEWKFADATGADVSMSIPVKDILALQKNNPNATLSLFYFSAQELPKGQMLASIKLGDKSVSRLQQTKGLNAEWTAFSPIFYNTNLKLSMRNLRA